MKVGYKPSLLCLFLVLYVPLLEAVWAAKRGTCQQSQTLRPNKREGVECSACSTFLDRVGDGRSVKRTEHLCVPLCCLAVL